MIATVVAALVGLVALGQQFMGPKDCEKPAALPATELVLTSHGNLNPQVDRLNRLQLRAANCTGSTPWQADEEFRIIELGAKPEDGQANLELRVRTQVKGERQWLWLMPKLGTMQTTIEVSGGSGSGNGARKRLTCEGAIGFGFAPLDAEQSIDVVEQGTELLQTRGTSVCWEEKHRLQFLRLQGEGLLVHRALE